MNSEYNNIIVAQVLSPSPKLQIQQPPWYMTAIFIPLILSVIGSVITLFGGYLLGKKLGIFNSKLTKQNLESTAKDKRIVELEGQVEKSQVIIAVERSQTSIEKKIAGVETSFETKIDGVRTELVDKIDGVRTELVDKIDGVRTELVDKIDGVRTELVDKIDGVETTLEGKITDSANSVRKEVKSLSNKLDQYIEQNETKQRKQDDRLLILENRV